MIPFLCASKSQRQKVQEWVPGGGEKGELRGCRVSARQDETVLEMDDGDDAPQPEST